MTDKTFTLSKLAVADINHNIRNPLAIIAGTILNYGDNDLYKEVDIQVERIVEYLKSLEPNKEIPSVYKDLV